jgi:hypothetical protein
MCDPQRLTALWAFTAWYRDSFAFYFTFYFTQIHTVGLNNYNLLHFSKFPLFSHLFCLEQKQTAIPGTVLVLHAGRQTHVHKKHCKQHSAGCIVKNWCQDMARRFSCEHSGCWKVHHYFTDHTTCLNKLLKFNEKC